MKPTLLLFLLLVGCAEAKRRHGRGRRNGADQDVTAINCIVSQCALVGMTLMQQNQMLFQMFSTPFPTAIRQFLLNITSDQEKFAKFCTDYKTLMDCPKDKCTPTADINTVLEAFNILDYPCTHQSDLTAHASCLSGVFAEDRLKSQFANGTQCGTAMKNMNEKYARIQSGMNTAPSRGTSRRRRQFLPQFTENPFPAFKRKFAEAMEQLVAPTCEEVLTIYDCVAKPIKDDCGDASVTLIKDSLKDISARQEKFIKAFAPGTEDKLPDFNKCLKEREEAATAFLKLLFY